MTKKLYVNDKLVAINDYKVEERDEAEYYDVKIRYDEWAEDPHQFNKSVLWYSNHRDYRLDGDVKDLQIEDGKTIDDFGNLHEFLEALNKDGNGKVVYYYVSAYIHSGIALYKGEYTGPDARWDSGIFAIVKVTLDDSGRTAKQMFDDDFDAMNPYICGNVYLCNVVNELGELQESYGGFYGDNVVKDMLDTIDPDYGITEEQIKEAFENMDY